MQDRFGGLTRTTGQKSEWQNYNYVEQLLFHDFYMLAIFSNVC